jgi:hypothetical protein
MNGRGLYLAAKLIWSSRIYSLCFCSRPYTLESEAGDAERLGPDMVTDEALPRAIYGRDSRKSVSHLFERRQFHVGNAVKRR